MNTQQILLVFTPIISMIVGFILGQYFTNSSKNTLSKILHINIKDLENRLSEEQRMKEEISLNYKKQSTDLTIKIVENRSLQEKIDSQKTELMQLQNKFATEFENLANKILEEKSSKFTEQNNVNIKNILIPLHEKIQRFERKVEDSQKENIGIHASLKEQLSQLQSQNLKITKEAENLTKALKGDSKMQGNWGELVLERVLEKSGLEKDREYFVQKSFLDVEGNRSMPDVVIHLPDNKKMIIDSKVSLTAFEKFINEEDDLLQAGFLKTHVQSIKKHIEQLSEKRYQDIYKMESPDFILLFIPMEPAFAVALNYDNSLYVKAFEKNIVIVTPSTLLATLRTIDSIWTNQKQQENAYEIARLAGSLYDKFAGFAEDLNKIGKKLTDTQTDYSSAMNKLVDGKGNIVITIEKLKKMGAKTQKSLPEQIIQKAQNGLSS